MKFSHRVRKWHKWIALIVGVQVFFWTLSGLFMSLVPIETVRSENLIKKAQSYPLDIYGNYISLSKAVESSSLSLKEVEGIRLRMFLDIPVFEIMDTKGTLKLIDALSGKVLSPISGELSRRVVLSRYSGDAKIKDVSLIDTPLSEYRSSYPLWRIDFDDYNETSFYVSPSDGSLKAIRSNVWRVYDFLWMLHIMDYSERENFNHWWLVLAAFFAVSVTITGFILFFSSFRRRDFPFAKIGRG